MASFEEIFMNFVIGSLLVLSLFMFVFQFQADNHALNPLSDNALISNMTGNLTTTLTNADTQSNQQKNEVFNETPETGGVFVMLKSVFSAGKTFSSITLGVYTLLIAVPSSVLGLNPIVTSVLSVVIVFGIIFALWYLWKIGGGG